MAERDRIEQSRFYNADLAPVPAGRRTWGTWNIAALWVGMAVCIPTYTLAAGMISQGMSWRQALATVALGNLIVLVPMILNAHPGTRYGVPFPVLVRSSFGTVGANVPALMRALVACGWFGIQTWIGGSAIYTLHAVIFGFKPAGPGDLIPVLGLSLGQLGCFLLFWVVNVAVILAGTESIKWLENLGAPFLLATGVVLLWWAVHEAGGLAAVLSDATIARVRGAAGGGFDFWRAFWPNLTAMVGFWATLSLNIPDFSRFARRQRDQVWGQTIGLPTTMALYSFIGIAVTSASVLVFGQAIWDPVQLLGRFHSKVAVGLALAGITVATLTTNIAANVVSPANDFSNLWPRRISFKLGGLITGVIGVLIMPWKLYSDLAEYIFTWLIGYSGLLGAVAGVMLADYYLIQRTRLDCDALYLERGRYAYGGSGFNWRALVAVALGIAVNVPGFLAQATGGAVHASPFFERIYTYAWFVSLAIAGAAHVALSLAFPPPASGRAAVGVKGAIENV
jgi:nucleobase:cation symporter-1, NCS1 family